MPNSMLNNRDKKVIWHPFTQHGIEKDFFPVKSARGAWLYLDTGEKILDAISSWWVNIHGHAHPVISQAIYQQSQILEHVIFAGFTHEPAIKLAEILVSALQRAGTALSRCFYSDNGSTAVEVAMKMAYQYYQNQGIKTRIRFLALNNSYHGDTLGSMTLSARGSYHQHFSELLSPVDFIDPEDLDGLKKLLSERSDQYAAIIVEPLVQAAGGMKMYSTQFLRDLAFLCKQSSILLICDEVFTGFYRTGTCFAFEQAGINPDFVCLAKGLTGGFLPLAVTLTTEEIFMGFKDDQINLAFLHGHSYTANPLSCAAALASWELLHEMETQAAIQRITDYTKQWIDHLSTYPGIDSPRALGTIGAINLSGIPNYFSRLSYQIRQYAISHGILLRPLGPVLSAVPPYCTTNDELDLIYGIMEKIIIKQSSFCEAIV